MDKKRKKTVSDSVCEVHKFSGYAVLSNCFVRSTNLSWASIALLARVMDSPSEQPVSKPMNMNSIYLVIGAVALIGIGAVAFMLTKKKSGKKQNVAYEPDESDYDDEPEIVETDDEDEMNFYDHEDNEK